MSFFLQQIDLFVSNHMVFLRNFLLTIATATYIFMFAEIFFENKIHSLIIPKYKVQFTEGEGNSHDAYFQKINKSKTDALIDTSTTIVKKGLSALPVFLSVLTKNPLFFVAYAGVYGVDILTCATLKNFVNKARPDDQNNKTSFPSGHAAYAISVAVIVFLFYRSNVSLLVFIPALFVILGRVLAKRHGFIDIFAGSMIGIFSAIICYQIAIYFNTKWNIFHH